MPAVGFEPTISTFERPQSYALDRAATGIGRNVSSTDKNSVMSFNKVLLSLMYVKLRLARERFVWNSCNSYGKFNANLTDGLVTLVHVWKDGWAWSPRKTFLFSLVKSA